MRPFPIFAVATMTMLLAGNALGETSGERINRMIAECHRLLTQRQFEALGQKLTVIKAADLKSFPLGFLCGACGGGTGIEAEVFEDGSIGVLGWQHTAFFPLDGDGMSPMWKEEVLVKRLQKMRFEPPHVGSEPVCVEYYVNWISDRPHEFLRWGSDEP